MKAPRRSSRIITFLASRKYAVLVLILSLIGVTPMIVYPMDTSLYSLDGVSAKQPLYGWCLQALSYLNDGVLTPRLVLLPSILGYLILTVCTFIFFSQRISIERALLGTLIMLTFVGMHGRVPFVSGVLLALMFLLLSLYGLYLWCERGQFSRIPWGPALLASGAILLYGAMVLVIPILVLVFYLLLRGSRFTEIVRAVLYYTFVALMLPMLWYWQQGLLDLALSIWDSSPSVVTPIIGLLPWVLLLVFVPWSEVNPAVRSIRKEKPYFLFSFLALSITLLLSIVFPKSFGALHLIAYPFAGMLSAEFIFYLVKDSRKRLIYFTWLLNLAVILLCAGMILLYTGDLSTIWRSDWTINTEYLMEQHKGIMIMLILVQVVAILTTIYQVHRKSYSKIAYSGVFLVYVAFLSLDTIEVLYTSFFGSAWGVISIL